MIRRRSEGPGAAESGRSAPPPSARAAERMRSEHDIRGGRARAANGASEHGRGGHPFGRLLSEIAGRVRLLGRATPVNFASEVARVSAAWEAGREEEPRFEYGPCVDLSAERAWLERVAEGGFVGGGRDGGVPRGADGMRSVIEGGEGAARALARLLAERARELAVEAAACEVAGKEAFWGLCRARFARRDGCDEEADRLADEWAAAEERGSVERGSVERGSGLGDRVASDDEGDPRSLVSAMRRAVGERRLPFRVVVSRSLAPLAATGEAVILVAARRWPSAEDTARTVLHEVMGHAAPAARAKRSGVSLLEVGTAFGSDDQEGRALLLEERAGFLGAARRRELALRHVAARAVEGRATLVDTGRILLRRGAAAGEAVRISARAHRGGGLAREVVYLPALVRVRAALAEEPGIDEVMGCGRVSVDAARALRRMGWEGAGR